jgi:hypothetical protein
MGGSVVGTSAVLGVGISGTAVAVAEDDDLKIERRQNIRKGKSRTSQAETSFWLSNCAAVSGNWVNEQLTAFVSARALRLRPACPEVVLSRD